MKSNTSFVYHTNGYLEISEKNKELTLNHSYRLEKTPYLGNFHAVKIVEKTVLLWVISCPSWSSLFDLISLGISLLQNNFHIRNKDFRLRRLFDYERTFNRKWPYDFIGFRDALQNQPYIAALLKRCSGNLQQIYRRTS